MDFQQIVTKEEYSHYDEQEVLFPPFLPLSIEKMSLTEQETHIKDMFGNPPVGKYLLKMGAFPDYRKIITSSKEELLGKILSTKGVAATCLRNMNAGLWDYDYQEYVNWKEDLHNYLKLVYSDLWYGEEENKEIKELYAYFDFPVLPEELKAEDIVKETRHDKKMEHGKIKFILLDKVGEATIYQDVTPEEMLTVLERV